MKFLSLKTVTGRVARRFIEAAISVVLAGLAAKYGDNQYYLLISPIIMGIMKAWREMRG